MGRDSAGKAIRRLVEVGVLAEDALGRYRFAPGVPDAYVALVRRVADVLESAPPSTGAAPAPAAFMRAGDGAPRLFGTDIRLRVFMALSKHGILSYDDLARITGSDHIVDENASNAPFGRGSQVRTWRVGEATYATLDPDYPVHEPLRRLLLKLEQTYPLRPFAPGAPPEPPTRRPWSGDHHVIFGNEVPMALLMTIAARGWTYEALCVEVAAGYDRVVVKTALRRLEEERLITGSRPRGPGFGPHVLRLSDDFPARVELEALLRACADAWPTYRERTQAALDHMIPKTRAYFKNRGIL